MVQNVKIVKVNRKSKWNVKNRETTLISTLERTVDGKGSLGKFNISTKH